MTPTQREIIERHKAFHAKIAERAYREPQPEPEPTPEIDPIPEPRSTIPGVSYNEMQEAHELLDRVQNYQGPRIDVIQRIVAKHFDVRQLDIISQRRTARVVVPRQVSMYLAKELTTRSLPEIGRRTGGRDHTTVIHAINKVSQLIKLRLDIAEKIAAIKAEIEA